MNYTYGEFIYDNTNIFIYSSFLIGVLNTLYIYVTNNRINKLIKDNKPPTYTVV